MLIKRDNRSKLKIRTKFSLIWKGCHLLTEKSLVHIKNPKKRSKHEIFVITGNQSKHDNLAHQVRSWNFYFVKKNGIYLSINSLVCVEIVPEFLKSFLVRVYLCIPFVQLYVLLLLNIPIKFLYIFKDHPFHSKFTCSTSKLQCNF
jgi:hypothetical protein